ncbi:MAG TPA: DUF899 family protein, partial [Planctomycetota bacterium]|nr:DUF899 family protein [Planctomycetota bacterium]
GSAVHLANHDVLLMAVSRAPLAQLLPFKQRMGWTFPWASSAGSDFNQDFNIAFSEEQQRDGGIDYNFRREGKLDGKAAEQWQSGSGDSPVEQCAAMAGTNALAYTRDRPGLSAFVLKNGMVYHTYSTYSRGVDGLWGMYQWLDRAPKGRNETGIWWRHHDRYATP